MNIDPKSMICGIPALDARKLMLALRGSSFNLANIKHVLTIDSERTRILLTDLQKCGYIEKYTGEEENDGLYSVTLQGSSLAIASAAKPFKRKSVDAAFNKFMQRVEEINASEDYLHKVSKVVIFGSYLGTKNI